MKISQKMYMRVTQVSGRKFTYLLPSKAQLKAIYNVGFSKRKGKIYL
jgi:hypothetical protein